MWVLDGHNEVHGATSGCFSLHPSSSIHVPVRPLQTFRPSKAVVPTHTSGVQADLDVTFVTIFQLEPDSNIHIYTIQMYLQRFTCIKTALL